MCNEIHILQPILHCIIHQQAVFAKCMDIMSVLNLNEDGKWNEVTGAQQQTVQRHVERYRHRIKRFTTLHNSKLAKLCEHRSHNE